MSLIKISPFWKSEVCEKTIENQGEIIQYILLHFCTFRISTRAQLLYLFIKNIILHF